MELTYEDAKEISEMALEPNLREVYVLSYLVLEDGEQPITDVMGVYSTLVGAHQAILKDMERFPSMVMDYYTVHRCEVDNGGAVLVDLTK